MSEPYKISLGVDVDVSDIQSQINTKAKNLDGIPIKVEIENLKDLKSQIRDLGKSNKNALTLDTSSIEKSLDRLSNTITDIKTSLDALDNKSGMESLLSSVNQIATALGKVENESDNLVKSLSALSKKDFSINFGIKLGDNSVKNNADYGDFARDVISKFELQAKHIDAAIKEQYSKIGKRLGSKADDYSGSAISQLMVDAFGYNNYDEYTSKFNGMYDKKNMSNQLAGWKNYFNLIEEAAQKMGIELSSIMNGFSADKYIQEAREIRSGTKETTDQIQTLKNVIGGGIDAEGLSAALESITQDLKIISEFIDELAKNNSIDGLTASFDRLSKALEPLTANFKNIQDIINTGFANANTGIKTEDIIPDSGEVVRAAEQVGKKIGEGIEDAVEQSLDIDDVIDKETLALMKGFNISSRGKSGKTAKDEIKGALTNYVNELKSGGRDIEYEMSDGIIITANTVDDARTKLVNTIADFKKASHDLTEEQQRMLSLIKGINDSGGAAKVNLLGMKSEWGDNYSTKKKVLGSWFADGYKGATDIGTWAEENNLLDVIGLGKDQSPSHQNIATALVNAVEKATEVYSGSELFKEGLLNIKEVESAVVSAANNISGVEQKLAQSSTESANTISQGEAKKQQAYEETKRKLDEVNRAIVEHEETITDPAKMASIGDIDAIQSYMDEMDTLAQKKKELESTLKTLEVSDVGRADVGLENVENGLREITIEANNTSDAVQSMRNAMSDMKFNNSSIDAVTKDLEEMNITIKKVTAKEKNGVLQITVKGINEAKEAVTVVKQLDDVTDSFNIVSTQISKPFDDGTQAVKKFRREAELAENIKLDIDAGKFSTQVKKIHSDANKLSNVTEELRIDLNALDTAESALSLARESGTIEEVVAAYKKYEFTLESVENQLKQNKIAEQNMNSAAALNQKAKGLSLDMDNWLKDNSAAAKQFGDAIRELQIRLESCNDVEFGNIKSEFQNIKKEAKSLGLTTKTVGDKLKEQFKQYSAYLGVAELFMWAEQGLRSMYDAVVEIDTAMTGLYRVTDLTSAQYDSLFDSMINSAKEYGATLTDIINATSDWVRAGFDADTSLGLAEVTTMYQHISDLDYDTAAENLITAYNGFKDELNGAFDGDQVAAVEYIADIFNELDNNFAVTSAGLGEALTRSASALDLAGNTIQQTAGMVTGITEVTQNPEEAGNTLKILSLRLRGMKGALEEIGEETDENVENISKMQGQVLNLTKGKVNIFDGAGEFRSTYEIMKDISEVWDDLNSTAQADLLETIAGKMLARIHRNMYKEYI